MANYFEYDGNEDEELTMNAYVALREELIEFRKKIDLDTTKTHVAMVLLDESLNRANAKIETLNNVIHTMKESIHLRITALNLRIDSIMEDENR